MLYGFGERPKRVVLNAFLAIVVFAVTYGLLDHCKLGCVVDSHGNPTDPWGFLYFSAVTFTTLGYGDLHPTDASRVVASAEALLGLVLAALFVHALARRTAGR